MTLYTYRGKSWGSVFPWSLMAHRIGGVVSDRFYNLGFHCVRLEVGP